MHVELNLDQRTPSIFYREFGQGPALVFLHGGWGYDIYPFDHQIRDFHQRFRILIPDRSGYGRSSRPGNFDPGFHRVAARETLAFMDAVGVEQAVIWGHSDGAVTAVLMALDEPDRVDGLILEATHHDRRKPLSKGFFETMVTQPERFGEKVVSILSYEHGESYWRKLLENEGNAWLDIHNTWQDPGRDLFEGRLSEVSRPTAFIHGAEDPRTEPHELAAIRDLLPSAAMHVIPGGGHSPHSEAVWPEVNRIVAEFLKGHDSADLD